MFPDDALHSIRDRAGVVLVQGFGRFGLFGPRKSDSTRRYDLRQDWGAFFWLPVVLAGVISAIRLGKQQHRQSHAPTGWALVVWSALALLVVTVYLPMAWDRYQLPIQAPPPCSRRCRWPARRRRCERGSPVLPRGADAIALASCRVVGFRPAGRQLCLLLAFARLEHRQPPDPDLCHG